jgi:putative spermidine/putrescine transport system ATP-binding protein
MDDSRLAAERTHVDIVDCAKTYPGGAAALQRTTLQVEPGEVLALLGPSGCGKTTLLRLIAGFVTPDAGGRIAFNNEDVTSVPIEARGVGMVFQHYALFPQMTVAANIGYGLNIRRVPAAQIRQRVGELIDLVRLNGLERRRPAELSGGQRQRVALARAVAVRPRVLLLDEPLTALDAKLKESLRDELAELLRRLHITAVHVTHDQQEAMAIADRLAVMHAGRIVQVGDPESLYRHPAHPFVAEFLGRVNRINRSAEDVELGIVRIGGSALACPEGLRDRTQLLLRPEDIVLQPFDANSNPGVEVTRRVFLGDRLQLQLRSGDANVLVCEAAKETPYRAGDRVQLSVLPHHLMPALGT